MTSTSVEAPPRCRAEGHGQMVLRNPPGGHTKEQEWCGTWYDCVRCHNSTLFPSPELRALHEQARRSL